VAGKEVSRPIQCDQIDVRRPAGGADLVRPERKRDARVYASRVIAPCTLIELADDDSSRRVSELLSAAGVDCRAIDLEPGASPVTEVVIAGGAAQTVVDTYRKLAADQAWDEPSRADVRSSRIVCCDQFFGDASRQVADWCVEACISYFTVDVAPDTEIARHAEVLVIPEEFTGRTLATEDAHEVVAGSVEQCSGLVMLTRGGRRLISARSGEPPRQHEPLPSR
jgi:sugar/nucleoside kinase (ribokinase family)